MRYGMFTVDWFLFRINIRLNACFDYWFNDRFLIFNLRIFGKKRGVFLGDSGSNLIGFWLHGFQYTANNQFYDIEPISLVWFIAIPL